MMLAPHAVACSLLAVGAACIASSSAWGEAPQFGAMLSETPLVENVPQGEPSVMMPRLSIAETWPGGERYSGETHGSAALPALLAPPCDEELNSNLVPMPVPHWAEQVTACAGTPNDRARRFDFLNLDGCSRVTLLDPHAAGERSAESAHNLNDGTWSSWSTGINAPASRIALPSKTALEPLFINSAARRPVAPSGTMYLWSTTSETRAAQGHSTAGTSAGVVLTRPPGVYSIDWIGIAVTAPVQWR
jgi:hypothetical protein